jgi:hypothetical protein
MRFKSLILFWLTSCAGPTTIVFIEGAPGVQQPETVIPTDIPVQGAPPAIPTVPLPLEVDPDVDVSCSGKGVLLAVKVNLKVIGGEPPYTVDGKVIDPTKPTLSLQAGQYNNFVIASSDGQAVSVKVYAPSSCDVQKTEDPSDPPPVSKPTSVSPTQVGVDPPATSVVVPPTDVPTAIIPTQPPVVVIDTPYKLQCNDGQDNDGDGKTDLDDPNCKKNKPDDDESK